MYGAIKSVLRRPPKIFQICRNIYNNSEVTTLKNRFRVATEGTDSSIVSIALMVEAGPRCETACYSGITHFIQHMAFKGFTSMTKESLEEEVKLNGAKIWSKTTPDMLIFSAQCLPEYTEKIVQIFYKIFTELKLDEKEMEKTRKDIIAEMYDLDDDHKHLTFEYLYTSAYQGTPLGQRITGNMENMIKFNKEHIQAYMCELTKPHSMVLAASGCVDHVSLVREATNTFGNLVEDKCSLRCDGPTRYTGSQVMYRDDSIPLAHVVIAVEAPGANDPDQLSLHVLRQLVGSWRKGQGCIQNEGNPDFCELYKSFYKAHYDTGLWGIYFVSSSLNLEESVYNIQNRWMSLCTCLRTAELERAVNALKLKLTKNYGNSTKNCFNIGKQVMYTGKRMDMCEVYNELDSLTTSKVQSAAEKYLYDRCPVVTAVGPTEGLPEYTRIRAGMYWLRL